MQTENFILAKIMNDYPLNLQVLTKEYLENYKNNR